MDVEVEDSLKNKERKGLRALQWDTGDMDIVVWIFQNIQRINKIF